MVLGLDLNDNISQISYMVDENSSPVTISQVAGEERYEIPTVLGKLNGPASWVYGAEALSLCENGEATKVEGLLSHAADDDTLVLEGEEFSSVDLLALFIKRMLSMTSLVEHWKKADRIVICADKLNDKLVRALKAASAQLDYPLEQIDIISQMESFYEYILHQKEELWRHDVVILDYTASKITARSLTVDRHTRPAVCRIKETTEDNCDTTDDQLFLEFCKEQLEGRIVTSVYLIGETMDDESMHDTLRYLCMKRRVFQGRNLYTKGACYSAWDKEHESQLTKAFLFLGRDKLKSNIGLRLTRGREEYYEPLVDAGVNWYDVSTRIEMYLGKDREIRLLLTPLTGRNEHYAIIRLADFPARESRTTRVSLELTMTGEDTAKVVVKDLGFGEIFPSSGAEVIEEILLQSEI